MKLFIDLYTDEDVDVLVAEMLRGRGFDVATTREAGQLGRNDDDQLAYAVAQQRAFLTHNRTDFEMLAETYFQRGHQHYGIIIALRHPPQEIVRRLLLVLDQMTADEFIDQLRYI
ncbi:DUF5615 family PIN-like protein [Candidatus Chloroploca sp. Khr17]|uniref:DUF5615 family PIN-like protein n=1 Tax=Candidatus Chloroploca sp. Khr17 TaxID=2496869 RepID=UPI00101B8EDA|nr:DUF5615 family PIN-like protein [Candidatus Chloroploca sp. Khr17]